MNAYTKMNMLFSKAIGIAEACELPYGTITEIKLNNTAHSRYGQCQYFHKDGTCKLNFNKDMIEKSSEDFIISTMLHEIIHTCPDCMNYGKNFKYYGNKVHTRFPQYKITTTSSSAAAGFDPTEGYYKYALVCEKCGKTVKKYKRMCGAIERPWRYRHTGCGGTVKAVAL